MSTIEKLIFTFPMYQAQHFIYFEFVFITDLCIVYLCTLIMIHLAVKKKQ